MKTTVLKFFRYILLLFLTFCANQSLHAQTSDSAKAARQHAIDSTRDAQKRYNDSVTAERKADQDSMRAAQKRMSDSIKAERNRVADSIASVRAYMKSKAYNDSLDLARQKRLDSIRAERERVSDSLALERKRVADSAMEARQKYNDSMRAAIAAQQAEQQRVRDSMVLAQKHVSDSIAAINAYRKSAVYKDSVAAVRKHINDSVTAVRKAYNDSLRAIQQRSLDSMVTARKAYNDSVKTALDHQREVRQAYMDSMAVVRQARTDSLAKAKELREAKAKVKEEEKKKKLKLSIELKIQKQQDAYTNEDMRKKQWNFMRKAMQNTLTRYNYFFNAYNKMQEAEDNMVRAGRDNYDSLMPLFVFNPDRDSSKVLSDMDTVIRKSSLGIQLHDPRGKWQDNLYMLVGQAYYYKGDYKNAAAAFKYIIAEAEAQRRKELKEKNKGKRSEPIKIEVAEVEKDGFAGVIQHRASKNDALLWLARTFTQNGLDGQAQSLLDMVKADENFPERLRGTLAQEQAFIYLKNDDLLNAKTQLSQVVDDNEISKTERQRAAFLLGQLAQKESDYATAQTAFEKTIDLKPPFEMDFHARMNLFNNTMLSNGDVATAKQALQQMTNDSKYRPYLDQVYYGLAKVNAKDNNIDEALDQYRKSVNYSQSNQKQKGLSYAGLADMYYQKGNFAAAKGAYDSALALMNPSDASYQNIATLAKTLEKIAEPLRVIQKQDSLLRLASLSEKEQKSAIRKHIREVEKLMRDSAYAASNVAVAPAAGIPSMNAGGSEWYFANASLMQNGSNSFKQKWGSRPLKDNWRRSSAGGSFANDNNAALDDEPSETNSLDEDSLLAAIPHTPEQIAAANNKLMEAYFQLGKAYYVQLENFPKAMESYDLLEGKYPNHTHQEEVLYHRYMMALRANDAPKIAQYLSDLETKYPNGVYTKTLIKPANSIVDLNTTSGDQAIGRHYDETYRMLVDREFQTVVDRANEITQLFPAQAGRYAKKYNLMKAIAIAGMGDYPKADTMLTEFLKLNPSDSLAQWATDVLNYIKKQQKDTASVSAGKNNNSPASNQDNTINQTNQANQPSAASDNAVANNNNNTNVNTNSNAVSTATNEKNTVAQYNYNGAAKQFVLISSQALDGKLMGLKAGMNDYNSLKHHDEKIQITITSLQDGRGIIVLKEFANIADTKKYIAEIKGHKDLTKEYVNGELDWFIITQENLNTLYQTNDYNAYKSFYFKNYK